MDRDDQPSAESTIHKPNILKRQNSVNYPFRKICLWRQITGVILLKMRRFVKLKELRLYAIFTP